MLKNLFLLGALTVLANCGTPEFRAEQGMCKAQWLQKIPPKLEQELYNRTQSRQVPTGQTICTGSGNTVICNQQMRTEFYTIPAVRTVDRNKPRRDVQINQCTRRICLEKFGNAECKA